MAVTVLVADDTLASYLSEVFARHGFDRDDAAFIAKTLVDADMQGISTHGVQRLAMYDHKLRHGMIDPTAKASLVSDIGCCAVMDGHSGMGQLISRDAMHLAVAKAHEHGMGIVAVRNSNHFGAAGFYARMAADQGLLGIAMTNSNPLLVPTHSSRAFLGSNPLAVAIGRDADQLVYDAATSAVSLGRIELLSKTRGTIPGAWAVDANGQREDSPDDVLSGMRNDPRVGGLTPLGGVGETDSGYKGYGMALVVETMTAVLSGGLASADLRGRLICHCFAAVSLEAFGRENAVRGRLATLLDRLRDLPSADGEPVIVPGDKERAHQALVDGTVRIDDATWTQIGTISRRLGIDAPPRIDT